MRIEQTCPCGASVVAVYGGSTFVDRDKREEAEAHKQLEIFRQAHVSCVQSRTVTVGEWEDVRDDS